MTTMKQFRWFWAWDDEKEENWLREMALKGWHFQSVALPGNYTFEYGEPRDDVYRLDYFYSKDKAGYLQLFLDAGWTYLGEMNNWQYFRKEVVDGVIPEIFTDNESKAKKYQRVMALLVIFCLLLGNSARLLSQARGIVPGISTFLVFLMLLFMIYGLTKLIGRVNQLKKKL